MSASVYKECELEKRRISTQHFQQVKSGATRQRSLCLHSLTGTLAVTLCEHRPATDTDFSLFKNFMLTEATTLSFRAEFFNIFNIQNYGAPDSLIGDPAAGRITSNVIPPRQIQSGLRLAF